LLKGEPVPGPTKMAEYLVPRLNQMASSHGIFELMIESGRFLVAESSMLISKIVNSKEFSEHKIVILDTGYHLLLDAALLKQEYPQELLSLPNSELKRTTMPTKSIHLAGRLCDTYDVFPLSKTSILEGADVGMYLSFYNVGAYSLVFNMPFHCQIKPPVIMKTSKEDFKLVRKGTSYEGLFMEEGGDII